MADHDVDSLYQAVTAADVTVALQLWDGKAFVNGVPSPVTCLVKAARLKANSTGAVGGPAGVSTPRGEGPGMNAGGGGRGAGGGGRGAGGGGRGGRGGRGGWNVGCHYCRNFRGVTDTTHTIDTCALWLAKKK